MKLKLPVVKEYPPNIEAVRSRFPIHGDVVFSYGGKLYNPGGGHVDEHLMAHEVRHAEQQKEIGTELWWQRYIEDDSFRYSQEVEAYSAQYRSFCDANKDRNERARFLAALAREMAQPLYGFDGVTASMARASIASSK